LATAARDGTARREGDILVIDRLDRDLLNDCEITLYCNTAHHRASSGVGSAAKAFTRRASRDAAIGSRTRALLVVAIFFFVVAIGLSAIESVIDPEVVAQSIQLATIDAEHLRRGPHPAGGLAQRLVDLDLRGVRRRDVGRRRLRRRLG